MAKVCTARPAPWFKATGWVGPEQLERLEVMLGELARSEACRVVLIHHPVTEGATSSRRSLTDAAEFRALLSRTGAELVLHGHNHRTQLAEIAGPDGPIPVVGVRSSSYLGKKSHKLAQYHLYDFEPNPSDRPGPRYRITIRTRAYDPTSARFVAAGERAL